MPPDLKIIVITLLTYYWNTTLRLQRPQPGENIIFIYQGNIFSILVRFFKHLPASLPNLVNTKEY